MSRCAPVSPRPAVRPALCLAALALCCSLQSACGRNYGRLFYGQRVVRAVGAAHAEGWLVDLEERQQCRPDLSLNKTLQPIIDAVYRCPNPDYRMREILPEAIVWTRVHKKQGRSGPSSSSSSSSSGRSLSQRLMDRLLNETNGDRGGTDPSVAYDDGSSWDSDDGSMLPAGSGASRRPGQLMAFLLTVPGDYFSAELAELTSALVPAYPQVLFLRGDGTLFSSFVAQISLKGFPQLLLFEDGLLKTRYRGRRKIESLIRFFVENTGYLPSTRVQPRRVRRAPPRPTCWYYLSCLFLLVESCLYVARSRRPAAEEDKEEQEGGGGQADVGPAQQQPATATGPVPDLLRAPYHQRQD